MVVVFQLDINMHFPLSAGTFIFSRDSYSKPLDCACCGDGTLFFPSWIDWRLQACATLATEIHSFFFFLFYSIFVEAILDLCTAFNVLEPTLRYIFVFC